MSLNDDVELRSNLLFAASSPEKQDLVHNGKPSDVDDK